MIRVAFTLALCLLATACQSPKPALWRTVFNGENLDGWVTQGGRHDGNADWQVEDGAIIGREGPNHSGGLIYTEQSYSDFEIEFDAFITYPFDSGVFCRMSPHAKGPQITLDYHPTGEVGGVFAGGWYQHNSTGRDRYLRDEWNHFRVRCTGDPIHLEAWMNGELLTDYTFPEGTTGFAKSGLIGLQVHGGRDDPEGSHAKFKNIRVLNLDDFDRAKNGALVLTPTGAAKGWLPLFNSVDYRGWERDGSGRGFAIREAELVFLAKGDSDHIVTTKDYEDFELRLEFKLSKMANSGLFLRGTRDGANPAYSGCEIQILDDFNYEEVSGNTLKDWQFTGSLYGAVAPAVAAMRPLGEWNTYEVRFEGSRLVTRLNGVELYDVDTQAEDFEVIQGPPFAERAEAGFIGLQRHAPAEVEGEAYAWYRNIWIREL